jgi:hypothetical protein
MISMVGFRCDGCMLPACEIDNLPASTRGMSTTSILSELDQTFEPGQMEMTRFEPPTSKFAMWTFHQHASVAAK